MNRIKYLTYIPIICFALLGAYDIGMDAWHGTLSWFQTIFNMVFFIPLIFRHRHVYAVCGVAFTALFGYLLWGGLYMLAANKITHISTFELFGVGIFFVFSFLCALSMLYVGAFANATHKSEQAFPDKKMVV